MRKIILTVIMVVGIATFGFVANAFATILPTVDGLIDGNGAWDAGNLNTFGVDPNEAGIPDQYDISSLSAIYANDGLATDGFYFMIDTFLPPSLLPGSDPDPGAQAFVSVTIDFDGDGNGDLVLNFNGGTEPGAGVLGIYNSSGVLIGHGTVGFGDVIEFYISESFYEGLGFSVDSDAGFSAYYDNRGTEPDDRSPNTGFTKPLPEPATLGLVGLGLLSSLGFGLRRFKK